jgi:hypothetical protein
MPISSHLILFLQLHVYAGVFASDGPLFLSCLCHWLPPISIFCLNPCSLLLIFSLIMYTFLLVYFQFKNETYINCIK